MPRWNGQLRAILLLSALLLIAFGRLVARPSDLLVDADHLNIDHAQPPDARAPGNDLTRFLLPHHLRIASQVARRGRPSAWDPSGFGGRPLVGNPQAGLWYPPVWLAWWSGRPAAFGWLTVAHLLWGGLGAYLLARSSGLGLGAALVAGGCFQLAPYVLAQAFEGHYPHVWAASWYPWAFAAALGLRRGHALASLMLPPILALAFLTGHPQEAYYLAIALGTWAASDLVIGILRGRGRDAWTRFGCWLALGALGSGLVALELVPVALTQPWTLQGPSPTIREAGRYHVSLLNLIQLLGPRALGGPGAYFGHENYWETLLAIGWAPLLLVAAAWTQVRKSQVVRGWAVLTAAATLFALGWRFGLFPILFLTVPGMSAFRVPARALFLASLGASMLAGSGFEAIARGVGDGTPWAIRQRRLVLGIIGTLIVGAIAGRSIGGHEEPIAPAISRPERPMGDLSRLARACAGLLGDPAFGASTLGTVAALTWLARRPLDRRRVACLLAAIALGERAAEGALLLKTAPAHRFLGPDPVGLALEKVRPSQPFRIRTRDAFYGDLRTVKTAPEKTNVQDSFQIQHAAELYEALYGLFGTGRPVDQSGPSACLSVRLAVLERMNVALVVSDRPVPGLDWPIVAEGRWETSRFIIQGHPEPLARAYVVPGAFVLSNEIPILPMLACFSARAGVVMADDPLAGSGRRQPFTTADYVSEDPDRVMIRVSTEAPGLLVVADTWMPGWSAVVDGRPTPIQRGNRAQRVVPLAHPGRHTIVMTYHAPGLVAGLWLSASSGLLWLVLALRAASRTVGTGTTPGADIAQEHGNKANTMDACVVSCHHALTSGGLA